MKISPFFIGALLFVAGVLGCHVLWGGDFRGLVFPVPFAALIFSSIGSAILAFGARDVLRMFCAFRVLVFNSNEEPTAARSAEVASYLIGSLYAVGALVFLLSLVLIVATLNDGLSFSMQTRMACSIFSIIYPILISEGLVRPLRQRLRQICDKGSANR